MKRSLATDISRCTIWLGIVVLPALMTGCGSENLGTRLDAFDRRMDAFTRDIKAYDAESRKRSAGHEGTIRQLEDRLTSQMASQKQELDHEDANLRMNLEAIKAELMNVSEREDNLQLILADLGTTASKDDLARLAEDVGKRYAKTQQFLADVAQNSAKAVRMSDHTRMAVQRPPRHGRANQGSYSHCCMDLRPA